MMMSEGVAATLGMVVHQFLEVGSTILIKAATNTGMSEFVFVVYSNLFALFLLLPSTFLYYRKRAPPPISTSIISRIFLLGGIRSAVQTLEYVGIGYSSPTLASATKDLVPAFAFILAIFSRMENVNLKLHSVAKMSGTAISIAGALIMTLYKGMPLTSSGSLLDRAFGESGSYLLGQSNWILGGFFLAISSLFLSLMFIVQTWIIRDYPEEPVVATTCCGFTVILSAIVAFFADRNPKSWKLRVDMELVSVLYSAIILIPIRNVVVAWICRKKGPFFVAMFNPFRMVIALAMSLLFLGDNIYLGSIIGGTTTAIGFYTVMWAKAQEENMVNVNNDKNEFVQSSTAPLLQKDNTDCA